MEAVTNIPLPTGECSWRHHREETGGRGERGKEEDGDSPAAEQLVSRRAASPDSHLVSGRAPQ